MAAVSIMQLLNLRIFLFTFLLFVSIVLSFLWVIINQIRISIKFGDCDQVEMETEPKSPDQVENEKLENDQSKFIEL